MNLPEAIYVIRWLLRDTFRQALVSGIFWLMLVISGMAIVVCLSVSAVGGKSVYPDDGGDNLMLPPSHPAAKDPQKLKRYGIDVASGELTVGFGALHIPFTRYRTEAVHYLQLLLAGFVADTIGVLLALVFTAGFLPGFVEPGAIAVLLAKPVPRWLLLLGKYLGVLTLVLAQGLVFVAGTWLALGMRTGVWDSTYLLSVPLMLLHFGIFFSVSVLIAVTTRSTVTCVFGSLAFWLVCWGMNYGRNVVATLPTVGDLSAPAYWLVEIGYWILPKPADLNMLLFDALQAGDSFGRPLDMQTLQKLGAFQPDLSVLSSIAFSLVALGLAAYEFTTSDY
jgi:ABC-type transport system involved in multi-copper enzyme maturation permease subunit